MALGEQHVITMTRYPIQPHYQDTEQTSRCSAPLLCPKVHVILSARLIVARAHVYIYVPSDLVTLKQLVPSSLYLV